TSPATTTMPVLMRVSTAMRDFGSWASKASTMASETWSHILSGWPSETDSEVKSTASVMVSSFVVVVGGYHSSFRCQLKYPHLDLESVAQSLQQMLSCPEAGMRGPVAQFFF